MSNTGNVAIKGISIDDRLNGLGDIKMSYPSKTGELAPGEKATGTASYSITNADILAGGVTNTAKAVGKNATTGASVESGESTVTTRLAKNPSIKIEKTADPTHIAPIDAVAGKEISYSFKITNTGNVNLGDIAVEDSMRDLGTVSPAKKSLAPGGVDDGSCDASRDGCRYRGRNRHEHREGDRERRRDGYQIRRGDCDDLDREGRVEDVVREDR